MATYDEIVKRNKDYLTQAQINALAAASREYNIANAGNRASALASAREQYDAGMRGLQNMGLAGNPAAAPTSGEVPRLQMQIKTPFDQYNERLKQVENQRLGQLGEQMKQETIAERQRQAAAAAAAREAQLRAAAEALRLKTESAGLRQTAVESRGLSGSTISSDIKRQRNVNMTDTGTNGVKAMAQDAADRANELGRIKTAAEMYGISTAANAAQERGAKLTAQLKGAADTSTMNTYAVDENARIQEVTQKARAAFDAAQKQVSSMQPTDAGYQTAVDQRNMLQTIAGTPKLAQAFVERNSPSTAIRKAANTFIAKFFSDETTKGMGYAAPTMTDAEFANVGKKVPAVRRILRVIDAERNAANEGRKVDQATIDEELEELKKLGYTEAQARQLIDGGDFDRERYARRDYLTWQQAWQAYYEHDGETPAQPVNKNEKDPTYRAVNRLADPDYNADTYYITDQERANEKVLGMNEQEVAAYNYIYEHQGVQAANAYIDAIKPLLEIQNAAADQEYLEKLASEKHVEAWLLARITNLVSSIPAMAEKLYVGAQNQAQGFRGGYEVPVRYSPDSTMSRASNWADVIQSKQSQDIIDYYNKKGKSGNIANFLYQTGTSMADSLIAMGVSGALGSGATYALFFSSAGNQAYKDTIARGGTQEQAMGMAVLSGAAEAVFEVVSLEKLTETMKVGGKPFAQVVKNALVQAGVEGSEEFFTEVANILSDVLVMKDKSELKAALDKGELGRYLLDTVGMATLGGLVSGAGFGGVAVGRYIGAKGVSAVMNTKAKKSLGENVIESGNVAQVKDTAILLGGDAAKAAKSVNEKNSASVGDMTEKTVRGIRELGQGTVEQNAAASRVLEGTKMTADDAQTVYDGLGEQGREVLQKNGYDMSTPESFMNEYNSVIEQNNVTSRTEHMAKAAEKRFTKAKEAAASRVWANPEQGLAYTTPEGKTVTPLPGNLTAVGLAEQERTGFKTRATATKGKVTYAVAGMEAREGLTNDQTYDEIQKGLTKDAQKKARLYEQLANALGVKMIIHDVMVGTNGFIDENGDMHVVLSGKQSVLRVAAHELTHYMKEHAGAEYGSLRKFLVAEVGQSKFDRMVRQKAKEYGLDLNTEKGKQVADDEVCAELCERMLSNEEALERFAEKDTAAAKTLKEHLLAILNAIKDAFKRPENRNFGESWSDLIKSQNTIESWITGTQKAIEKADARAKTNEGKIAEVAGVTSVDEQELIDDVKDAKTDAAVDDAINEHSVDIIEHDMAGYMDDLTKAGVMTDAEISTLFDTMTKAIDKVMMHRAILDFGPQLSEAAQNDPELAEKEIREMKQGRAYLPYKQNADPHYKLALDFSTLCRKRVLLQTIQERLQAKLGRALSQEETVAIRIELQNLKKNNAKEFSKIEVACALCYVEAARLKSPKVINAFLNNTKAEMQNYFAKKNPATKEIILGMQQQWKVDHGYAPDTTKKQMSSADVTAFNTDSRSIREQFESDHPAEQVTIQRAIDLANDKHVMIGGIEFPGRETFLSASWLTKLKGIEPDIFNAFTDKVRSATRSKAQETDTFYSRGDIDMVTESILNYANAESGFRHQSWSDFVPTHLLDTMAAVIEMSTRKAKMHAYTKVPAMVRLLGKTGMMLNMSLIPSGQTGINADGTLAWDPVEGMPWETMLALRDMFPDTAGNIAIGISDEQIRALLESPDIDYVIPYHASGMNKSMRGYMDIKSWAEYTSSQNEKSNHRGPKGKSPELAEWFDEKEAAKAEDGYAFMRAASEKYLQLCADPQHNLVPKFSQYLQNNGDGSYSLKEGYENYWKLLIDRKMVNQATGRVIIQQAVKPTFDQGTVLGILEDRIADPAVQQQEKAADIVTEKFSGWQANRNNADAEAIQAAKDMRDNAAKYAAQEAGKAMHSLDEEHTSQYSPETIERLEGVSEFLDQISNGDAQLRERLVSALMAVMGEKVTSNKKRPMKPVQTDQKQPGMKPAGKQPRVRDVLVPERAKTGDRVSDFVRSFLESDKASDEIVSDLMDKIENGEWGSYTQLSNQEAMDRAKGVIARKQFVEAQADFHAMVASGKYNVHTRALGLQLLTEAANRGDKAAVLDIAADLRELATDAGQSLQIFSVMKELGGVGAAWYMQKEIDRLNNQYADEIASGKMPEITVTPELMQQLMQATTQSDIEAAEDAIAEHIAGQLPLTTKSKIVNWRYLSMLGNPTTHFRNLTGNVFMAGLNAAKDVVAVGAQRAAEKVGLASREDRAHAVLNKKDRQMWKDIAAQSFQEQEKNLRGSGKNGFGSFIQQHMRSFDNKTLNAIAQGSKNGKNVLTRNGVMGMLEVEDVWFLRPAYQNAFMQYMKAQGFTVQDGVVGKVKNGEFTEITTAEMSRAVDWASQQAWKATFRDASTIASILNNASQKLGLVGHVLIEGVMPFKKTPVNIAKRGIEYSPVGVIMGGVQLMRDVKQGKMTAAQAIDNLASGVVGTSLMALGMALAKAGLIRAGGEDKKKEETYLQDTGDQTYSLKFGDVSVGISALAPAAIPLLMGAALYDALDNNGEAPDLSSVTETVAGTLDPFMEMSVVSSLNSALKNYNNNGIGGALGNTIMTAIQSYGSQFLPTVTGKVGQFIDPTVRTTKSSAASPIGSNLDYYARSLVKKVPGLEATLEPDVNVWGRETKKDGFASWALDFANKFLLPVNVKIANRDSVDEELMRIVESTGDVNILPSDGAKYFTVSGEKYSMTAAQYTEFSKDRGNASYAALKETMNSPAYQNASDEEKASMLENALSAAQKQVNTIWKEKLGAFDSNTEKPAEGVKAIQGDYSDPALYKVAASYPKAYDKAAKAKAKGISPDTFLDLYEKKDTYSGENLTKYTRQEIMNSKLTVDQKNFMDDLIVSDKGRNPDYSSQTWFDISMISEKRYNEAKEGTKIGLKPDTYLAAYNMFFKTLSGDTKKHDAKAYLDSLTISAPVYDYLWYTVFDYHTPPAKVK